jgi:hypothetical protein
MPPSTRLLSLIAAAMAAVLPARAANLDGSAPDVGNAEAARLYTEANAYVTNMSERDYSYAYLQFYWKRAQANVDRIRRVYADSPTAKSMARGEMKLGPFELEYFKTRVLYNLELKQLGSFDDVNCAIFLYGLDESRSDDLRNAALSDILEVLARRQRWGEALRFPVLDAHRPILLGSIFRVAAFYSQTQILDQMSRSATASQRAAAGFDATTAEALALLGKPRADLYKFVDSHPTAAVRTAALRGVVQRAMLIHRMETHHLPQGQAIQTVHVVVQNLSLRDDVPAAAAEIFKGRHGDAAPLLAEYEASLGAQPNAGAPLDAHLAYLRYLADSGRLADAAEYAGKAGLSGERLRGCELKAIELAAEAGQGADAERLRAAFAAGGPRDANLAGLAEFRGQMDSTEVPLVARTKTFAELPITDPCVMAVAIMDWSLTPNRSQRGATPWDAVVFKFAGGFNNLPKPKSTAVSNAASTVKPY